MGSNYKLFRLRIDTCYIDEVLECYNCCGILELVTWVKGLETGGVFLVQSGKVMRVGMEE